MKVRAVHSILDDASDGLWGNTQRAKWCTLPDTQYSCHPIYIIIYYALQRLKRQGSCLATASLSWSISGRHARLWWLKTKWWRQLRLGEILDIEHNENVALPIHMMHPENWSGPDPICNRRFVNKIRSARVQGG
jgi:hypothetical protein